MKRNIIFSMLIALLLLNIFSISYSKAPVDVNGDKTLSPYFMVTSSDTGIDALPLLSTAADVHIVGVIADVRITQTYKNNGKKPIEAIYVFPGSTRAAVYSMTMKIGERLLVAEIQRREEARQTYEKAKSEGKTASLLEQERPNVFQMNVANILPGDIIEVEMKYTELLEPEDGIYSFIYPTVVGPRYSNKTKGAANGSDEFVASPYQHEGEMPLYKFGLKVRLDAGLPIDEIISKTHKIKVDYDNADKESASVLLDESESNGGNRDFIINYRLTGNKIQTGLLLSKGLKENFFLLMLQPPKSSEKVILPAREYIFVVDVSGSMWGFPLDISKAMMKKLLSDLQPGDMFNVLLFAGSSEFMSCESMPASPENIERAIKLIESQRGGGGTEILPALKKIYNVPKKVGFSRTIAILTDGYVDIEDEVFTLIKENLSQANVFAFGIGSSVNRFLIEGIARIGKGKDFVALKKEEAEIEAEKFQSYINYPVMTNIKVTFDGFDAYDMEPQNVPDVFSQRPIIIFGKWRGNPTGNIIVEGLAGKTELQTVVNLREFGTIDTSQALKYLWARHRIAELSDYAGISNDTSLEGKITQLGLNYNLLTKYTSFVAVDYQTRTGEKSVTVKQPLPLPEGVSDNAIGGARMMSTGLSSGTQSTGGGFVGSSSNIMVQSSKQMLAPTQIGTMRKTVTDEDLADFSVGDDGATKRNLNLINFLEKEFASISYSENKNFFAKISFDRKGLITNIQIHSIGLSTKQSDAIKQLIGKKVDNYKADSEVDVFLNVTFAKKANKANISIISIENPSEQDKEKSFISINDIKEGTGRSVKKGSKVSINIIAYTDYCNKSIDTYADNKPIAFTCDETTDIDFLIIEGIMGMKAGGKRMITSNIYGDEIKYYEVELIDVK